MIKAFSTFTNFINRSSLIIILVILIGAFFRFYKLDWGESNFAHPDEYHIVIAVNKLSFPTQMDPDFFSYGTVTIYLIYFTKSLLFALSSELGALSPFLIGRFYSALFSTLTIYLVFKVASNFVSYRFALVSALLCALTPGLIQQAHYTTPESALIFFIFLSLHFLLKYCQNSSFKDLALASIALGLSLGVKISTVVFGGALGLVLILKNWNKPKRLILLSTLSALLIFLAVGIGAPFIFLGYPKFRGNVEYEGGLAAGKFEVFYTRQFINTPPFLFQMIKIFPVTLGLSLEIFGFLGLMFLIFKVLKEHDFKGSILLFSFLVFFIPNSLLFAKWTRFISPTFAFFSIFSAILLSKISKFDKVLGYFLTVVCLTLTVVWSLAFFSIYINPDIRVTSSSWLENHLPQRSSFFLEGGNTVDLPLRGDYQKVSLDFYPFDESDKTRDEIARELEKADYFLVQSRRVFLNHQRLPEKFPKLAAFYSKLFAGQLGFTFIQEFHSFPSLAYLGIPIEFPDEMSEETWSVFDHPVIRVFQKQTRFTHDEYLKLFEN